MFWGLIVEPNKRYTQVVEKPFHISQAAMDTSTGDNDPCQVMVVVDSKNFLVCTLQKNKCIQVPLDLYFKTGDSIAFLTNGKCNIHLTGYLDPEFEDEPSDDDEEGEDEEEEVPALVPAKNKRKLENNTDATASKKAKQEKAKAKKPVPADSSDDDDDDDDDDDAANQLQKLLDGEEADTDENDESFKVNTSAEASDDDEEDSDEEEAEDEDEEEEEEKEEASSDEAETTLDTSKEESKIDTSKLTKSQKRRLRKKQKAQEKQPQVNGVEKAKKEKPEAKAEKKKPEKKEAQEAPADKKEKKSLSGGVQIEDLKVGSGPAAKPGKTVMVYYEGRLKQNNKMFDNCVKGPGFKFRLGAKEVISGWDIGVNGMKVGGKRKIICPPTMAYGAKGSPPVIPPNSTLVFEVELKNVK